MFEVDTEEIADVLCKLYEDKGYELTQEEESQVEEAIFHLKSLAQNPYNAEYFRTLYKVLEGIVDC